MTDAIDRIEERLAHLIAQIEDLSDVVARQDRTIDTLSGKVELLMRREASRDADGSGAHLYGDERPPHY
ncbi:SlyX protein [Roseivivax lentus]|uniref:SlyX protein n=1 Tax=Roseivivax lentus TaxID=633194 RepID=A0A1N7KEU7_9RHOB|nr:SlyX family protein [Roseivivax lentus]SIS60113.1 SlyX protein [Roseivivax lentus]